MATNFKAWHTPRQSLPLEWKEAASKLASEHDHIQAILAATAPVRVETRDSGDIRDLVTDDATREVDWHRRDTLVNRLRLITEATGRLTAGTFGRCVECDESIAPRRLESDPATPLCIACQSRAEENRLAPSL